MTDDEAAMDIASLRARGTAKWSRYSHEVLGAWVAEMDFPLDARIKAALVEAIDRNATGYPVPDIGTQLPAAIQAWIAKQHNLTIAPDQVRIIPDILHGMMAGIEAFSPPGSPVIVTTPSYPPFFEVLRAVNRPMIDVPMLFDELGRARYDINALDQAFSAGAKTLILCNPYNPLGRVFSKDELQEVANVVEMHRGRVIADEVHSPLVYPGYDFTPYAKISEESFAHSITLFSASKGWNIPGLKCASALITNPDDIESWDNLSRLKTHGASILGIIANTTALTDGQPWLDNIINRLDQNRLLLRDLLSEHLPNVKYWIPEGTYLAWLDCTSLKVENPMEFFLERAHVAVNDGQTFGHLGMGFVRLNFATSSAILTRIVKQMGAAVGDLSG